MRQKLLNRITMLFCVLLVLATGCEHDSSSTISDPNQPVKANNREVANFLTEEWTCDVLSGWSENSLFYVCGIPAGTVATITYTTLIDTFCVALEMKENKALIFGLQKGDVVSEAYLQTGTLIDRSGPTWNESAATLYAWPGGPECHAVFQTDQTFPRALLFSEEAFTRCRRRVLISYTACYTACPLSLDGECERACGRQYLQDMKQQCLPES